LRGVGVIGGFEGQKPLAAKNAKENAEELTERVERSSGYNAALRLLGNCLVVLGVLCALCGQEFSTTKAAG
jgi:uncharacterized protein YjeT (DUF2065 family)